MTFSTPQAPLPKDDKMICKFFPEGGHLVQICLDSSI